MSRRNRICFFMIALPAVLIAGCNNSDKNVHLNASAKQVSRAQDSRTFVVKASQKAKLKTFRNSGDSSATRVSGLIDAANDKRAKAGGKAAYEIAVPNNWNGILVMWAHGYRGMGKALTVNPPPIAKYLVTHGYAWAASSYSTNYYDVRAGIEDTNNLALKFRKLVNNNTARTVNDPTEIYIVGESMGGHVTAAAIESATYANENHKVQYAGAVPMCGVVGDGRVEFPYLLNFTFAAQHVAGMGPNKFPATGFNTQKIYSVLFKKDHRPPTKPAYTKKIKLGELTDKGQKLEKIVAQLTGGDRPVFDAGFRGYYNRVVMGQGGMDGTIDGILVRNYLGNANFKYQFDDDPALSSAEKRFNNSILRVHRNPDANSPRPNGLRWIPRVNGQFSVPVVTIHGLGDLYVPFSNEQVYRRRAMKNGNGDRLVQRAIRSAPHCDFTQAEMDSAFSAMAAWEQDGIKPKGNDVLDKQKLAKPDYGCQFTTKDVAHVAACPNES